MTVPAVTFARLGSGPGWQRAPPLTSVSQRYVKLSPNAFVPGVAGIVTRTRWPPWLSLTCLWVMDIVVGATGL